VVPGRIGDDGKVHPIEHVLQLQQSSIKDPKNRNDDDDSDEDSDDGHKNR